MFSCQFFEGLKRMIDQIPLTDRPKYAFEYDRIEGDVLKCVEGSYRQASERLLNLFYYTEWAKTLSNNEQIRPDLPRQSPDRMGFLFHDIEGMTSKETGILNSRFSDWVMNTAMRELSEFLLFYLMNLYDICAIIQYSDKPIKPEHIIDELQKSRKFRDDSMKDRLKSLKDLFGFNLTHHQEILSLYEARNVFSHYDGEVKDHFCNEKGEMQILWPVNRVRMRLPGRERLIPYNKVPKPFEGGGQLVISWLDKVDVRVYKVGEKIKLTYEDLNNLIFFYLHVFNELQAALIDHVNAQGVKTRPFDEYALSPEITGMVVDGEPINLSLKS